MPEANQYVFSNKELLELLIKQAGVREGRWMLMANFGFTAANFGQADDSIAPGGAMVIQQMGIQKAPQGTPLGASVDAAVINPAPKGVV
jgi:hypothetical protein